MNVKRYLLAVVGAYVAMGVCASLLVMAFGEQMESMSALGRPMEEMMRLLWVQMLGYLVITCVLVYLYTRYRQDGGVKEGATFGALIGLAMCGMSMWSYSVYPWELGTLYADMFINVVNYAIGGAVASLLYKPA